MILEASIVNCPMNNYRDKCDTSAYQAFTAETQPGTLRKGPYDVEEQIRFRAENIRLVG